MRSKLGYWQGMTSNRDSSGGFTVVNPDEVEELYLVTRGTLTMRFGDEIRTVRAPADAKRHRE
jgi:mannose-6-phosphate isomerase-like protein (cupin superfamily)